MADLLDNLRHGAHVRDRDGKEVGKLHAVVVDPNDNDVTHIVVNAGPHFPEPGFGAPHLINVPIEQMADAEENAVVLRCTRDEFRRLPEYVDRAHAAPPSAPEEPPPAEGGPVRRLWDVGVAMARALASVGGIAVPAETFRRAAFERHILNDAPVWRSDPHTHIGDVERVLIDEATDEIEALVIRRGALFHHDVILPVEYVTEILDGVVHVNITDADLEHLKPFWTEE